MDFENFVQNSAPWRGVDFWMLNDRLDDEQLRFELTEMYDKGVRSFIARTYTGLKSDYPGPGFKAKMHTIVNCAKELGMKLYLQAGFMPEAVFDLPEEYTACCIKSKEDGGYEFCRTEYYVDMLNPEAVEFYLRKSYEEMWQEFSSEFGKTILSVWVDEPSYSSAGLPWSEALSRRYKERWGEEIDIDALFRNTPGSGEKRFRYWNTLIRQLETSYFKQVQTWCHEHDLLFSGHLLGEGTFHSNFSRGGAMMPFYRWFDVPGIDYLTADMCFEDSPLPRLVENQYAAPDLYTTPLQCVSAANQAGKEKILCEMYGVSSENLALRDQLYLFNRFASFGINCRSVHGYFYSLRGRGKRAYPPHVNYYQPYWEHYGQLTDECALNAWFVSQGKSTARVLVLLPWNTAAALYAREEMGPDGIPALAELEQSFLDLERQLLGAGIGFELGDEFVIEDEGAVENGKFVVGKCAYDAVVLPWTAKLTPPVLELLDRFAAAGGTLFALGETPCTKAENLPGTTALLKKLEPFRAIDFASDDGTSLQTLFRREENGEELLFVFNTDCRKKHWIKLSSSAALLERDGTLSEMLDHFTLPPGGALRLVLKKERVPAAAARSVVSSFQLPDEWQLERRSPNALVLEFARFKREGEEKWSKDYPVIAIHEMLTAEKYEGDIALLFEISSEEEFRNCALALESPEEFIILLNGEDVSAESSGFFCAREFETVLLPPLKKGKNLLELRRYFFPLSAPKKGVTELFEHLKGVELETPFLIGDFALESFREPTRCQGVVRLSREFALKKESNLCTGELTAEGFPFFAGKIILRQTFEAGELSGDFFLRFEHLNTAVLKVKLNGEDEGIVYMPPYRCRLSHIKAGENLLELELFSSLRNLLGPSHRPGGEYGRCFGGYGHPNKNWIGAVDEMGKKFPDWQEHRRPDSSAWTESFMLVPFGLSGALIEQEKR